MIDLPLIPRKAGVYLFTNKINGKFYVGKAFDLYRRMHYHKGKMTGLYFSHAIQKYGWENFDLEILQEYDKGIDNNILLALETAFIDFYESLSSQNGYNIMLFGTDRTGIKHTPETKLKMSNAAKGRILSEEHKEKLRLSHVGIPRSEETKKKISQNSARHNLGKKLPPHSEEHKQKISEGLLRTNRKGEKSPNWGRKHTEEWKIAMSFRVSKEKNPNWGKTPSLETRKRLSESNKKRFQKEEERAKIKKPVKETKINTGEIIIYPSATDAAKQLGIKGTGLICLICQFSKKGNHNRTAYGSKWEYV